MSTGAHPANQFVSRVAQSCDRRVVTPCRRRDGSVAVGAEAGVEPRVIADTGLEETKVSKR